jgi:hypothetical protein
MRHLLAQGSISERPRAGWWDWGDPALTAIQATEWTICSKTEETITATNRDLVIKRQAARR